MFRRLFSLLVAAGASSAFAGQLMITDSGRDRVWLFSDFDGSVIRNDFIVDSALSTAIHAIESGRGTILISDQILDSVREYSMAGAYLGDIANATTHGIDNVRGIAVRNGQLYMTIGGGTHNNTVQRVNLDGTGQTTWASTNVSGPFDIHFRANDAIVSNITSDNLERYDFNGNWLGTLHNSDGATGIDFSQQIYEQTNGNLLVAGFSDPAGLYEFSSTGTQLLYHNPNLAVRGIYRLGNGNILFTGGTDVRVYNPTTNTSSLVHRDAASSFRYIEATAVPEPATLIGLGIGSLSLLRKRRRSR